MSSFIDSFEKLARFINLWIGINIVCALVGLNHGGKVPFSGFMGDENDFALVMNMAIPFAYFMFLGTDSVKKKVIYLSACGFFIAANVASLSRGGFVGLVPVVLYCWYKTPKKILATIIVAIMLGVLYLTAPATYWDEVKSIKEENIKEGTGEGRWYAWKIGWHIFLDHPIIGVGTGNYQWHAGKYQPEEDLKYRPGIAGRAAHSLYFTLIPELGLIGILLFSKMLLSSFKGVKFVLTAEKGNVTPEYHKLRFIALGTTGALIGYLVSGALLSVFYYPHFWVLISILESTKEIAKNRQ